jgi:3-oxoacyl-[acyl-carrier protein] reductase
VLNGRDSAALETTASDLRGEAPGVRVVVCEGDVTEEKTRRALVEAAGAPDILVNNAGGPPPGDFRDWDRQTWLAALDANMLSAIDLIRLTVDGMSDRGFGRIVNITSSTVRVPIAVLGLSNAARAGLTGFVGGLAQTVSAKGVTINNILPGPFDTNRLRHSKEITKHLTTNRVAGRVGDPAELGAACAFLCSRHAGYITGQNLLLDGGLNPGFS